MENEELLVILGRVDGGVAFKVLRVDEHAARKRAAAELLKEAGYHTAAFVSGPTVVPLDPSGETTIDINGWQLVVRGTPADGDTFSVRDNAGGIGDNRNALDLAALADQRIIGGTTSFSDSYAELVADVGIKTRQANLNAEVHGQLLSESVSQREAISGVNLDEEAANLIRFQQAYEASAQVIAAAGEMIDSLLQAIR